MKFGKMAEASHANQIKSSFIFTATAVSEAKENNRRFRDPLGLDISRRIASQLRAGGFSVTDVKPGSACDAAFNIRFPKFDVVSILLANRSSGIVKCSIATWCVRAFWRRVSPQEVSEGWTRACTAIEKALTQDPTVTSLLWLTEEEADAHYDKADAMPPLDPRL
jgi:hypothetical protein